MRCSEIRRAIQFLRAVEQGEDVQKWCRDTVVKSSLGARMVKQGACLYTRALSDAWVGLAAADDARVVSTDTNANLVEVVSPPHVTRLWFNYRVS